MTFPRGFVRGRSPVMLRLYEQLEALAGCAAPILLLGETGVGKEMVARTLHESSPRRRGPFVAVNCAAIPAELAEAELFGTGRGVASGVLERPGCFQLASGGTLLLDEIGALPFGLQAKLLRALQGPEIQPLGESPIRVDIRVIAATNADVDQKVERGEFRSDLYYRLAGFVVEVPPLRDRREDIAGLVEAFARAFGQEIGRPAPKIAQATLRALAAHDWPGNVRELQHEVRRLVQLGPVSGTADPSLLSPRLRDPERAREAPLSSLSIAAHTARLEQRLIREAMARTGGRRGRAARLLGISRNGLSVKIERLGLKPASDAIADVG